MLCFKAFLKSLTNKTCLKQVKVWSAPGHVPLSEKWNQAVFTSVSFLDKLSDYFANETPSLKSIEEKAKSVIS